MGVKVLFLDYDGVIADSMPAKASAMADAFAPYTRERDAVVEGFKRHAGSGRELVFDRIYEHLTGETLEDPARRRIEEAFLGRIDAINAAIDLFPGVHDFIADQSTKRLLAVVTGVPQVEVERALTRLDLHRFLTSVHAATRRQPKHVLMRSFLSAHGITAPDALFAGDSHTDMHEAARAGVPFVGIGEPGFFADGAPVAVARRLIDLARLLDD